MKAEGLWGAVLGTVKKTTIADPAAQRAGDLANRDFKPPASDQLWVAVITWVSSWSGWGVRRARDRRARPPGPRVALWSLSTQLILDALEQAV